MTENGPSWVLTGGIFSGSLTILFAVLKLTHHIAWSWWWILSPLWIYAAIILTLLVILFFVAVEFW